MKIAVCFWGQIRTGIHSHPSILSYFDGLLGNIDFFTHTWDTETISYCEINENPMLPDYQSLKEKKYNDLSTFQIEVPKEKLNNFLNIYQPKRFKIDNPLNFKFSLPAHYRSRYEVNLLKQDYEKNNNFEYDVVISMRPDLIFNSSTKLSADLNKVNLNGTNIYNRHHTDLENKEELIESLFIIGNSKNMDLFSSFKTCDTNTGEDTQRLDYKYSTSRGLNLKRIINYDFRVFRYYNKFMFDMGISFDQMIQNFYLGKII